MWTTLEEAMTAARAQSTLDSVPTLIGLIQSWRTEQLDGVWGKQSETIGTIYLTSALLIYLWQLQLSQRILVGDCRALWRQSPVFTPRTSSAVLSIITIRLNGVDWEQIWQLKTGHPPGTVVDQQQQQSQPVTACSPPKRTPLWLGNRSPFRQHSSV